MNSKNSAVDCWSSGSYFQLNAVSRPQVNVICKNVLPCSEARPQTSNNNHRSVYRTMRNHWAFNFCILPPLWALSGARKSFSRQLTDWGTLCFPQGKESINRRSRAVCLAPATLLTGGDAGAQNPPSTWSTCPRGWRVFINNRLLRESRHLKGQRKEFVVAPQAPLYNRKAAIIECNDFLVC